MKKEDTFIQYGVPNDWAKSYVSKQLSVTSFRNLSNKILQDSFSIPIDQIKFVKRCLKRTPIEDNIVNQLLENNNYTCCLCKGTKGTSFIIHHINHYSTSQNNNYENLAVLCPNDHDLVHKEGNSLTLKITKEQIIKSKRKWEKEVETRNAQAASQNGEIEEVDFINAPRVLELYYQIYQDKPHSEYSSKLLSLGVLDSAGSINQSSKEENDIRNHLTDFNSHGPVGSWMLRAHFLDAFKQLLNKISFVDLDGLMNRKSLYSNILIGSYCFYVGGLYSKAISIPITEQTPITHLYFHRKDFFIEWLVDPKWLVSTSAIARFGEKKEYLIYGRIRGIGKKSWKGKDYIHYDIRPYLFGLPTKTKSRRPPIHYIDKWNGFDVGD
ncbi:HNH endonuclease signature motif containing protein [Chitinophaga filiformis]|uniref:5-methylcytosine-specific restriction endonuclease McrA n=1 Tax=Chitinophaga filiformis TaxID=104663 RepID=A0A1G8EAH3_CHIFI|nr:HNH endonuclease [Chitinophaga filiformis]SDH66740.1 5-methylcytosine-specific restriction endonuclease McrA [Chitinophaga filiformis]